MPKEIFHEIKKTKGHWEVVCGGMFAGKTEELIRRIKRALIAKQFVQVFKPVIDDRYDKKAVVSHDGRKVESIVVKSAREILDYIDERTEVVGIDEAQFFGKDILDVGDELADRGIRVIFAGLDQTYEGKAFGVMPELLIGAEYVTKVLAICIECGMPAGRSFRIVEAKGDVLVGDKDKYKAVCRHCLKKLNGCSLEQDIPIRRVGGV
jgi:thymidine kinase